MDKSNRVVNGERVVHKNHRKVLSLAVLFMFLSISEASALTIVTRFIGGTPPLDSSGSGNLTVIVNAAARMWESVYADPITVTLDYGWASIPDAGNHIAIGFNERGDQELVGLLLFDNSGATPFYLDPTPDINEEYQQNVEEYQDFGGGSINVARIFKQPAGDAAKFVDLFSVVLHEIGHAMGLSVGNHSFALESKNGFILLSDRLPFAGTTAPLARNNTGFIPHFDVTEVAYGSLMGGVNADERRIPSELDILTNAQISGYTIRSLAPAIESKPALAEVLADFWWPVWTKFFDAERIFISKTRKTRTSLSPRVVLWRR